MANKFNIGDKVIIISTRDFGIGRFIGKVGSIILIRYNHLLPYTVQFECSKPPPSLGPEWERVRFFEREIILDTPMSRALYGNI